MNSEPSAAEAILVQMVLLWRHGDAARQDPVLSRHLARYAACLNRLAPGLADRARAEFEQPASSMTTPAREAR